MRHSLLALALVVSGVGCTWVPMQSGASAVRVVATGASTAGCTRLADLEVNVTERVGFYERNALRVREELETLARNEALELGANAVQPLSEPADGGQKFSAWRCPR